MKAHLTKSLVDNAEAPIKGESWIADTKIRGFGLRLWRNSNGTAKKSYALRIKGLEGKSIRKTFSPYLAQREIWEKERWDEWPKINNNTEYFTPDNISLGQLIHSARKWAQDEVDKIKGRKLYGNGFTKIVRITLDEELKQQNSQLQTRIQSYTFRKAKEIQLKRMKTRGVSQTYLDRLDGVFETYIPLELKTKNLFKIQKDEVRNALLAIDKISNLKMLRPFIGQILDLPIPFGLRCQVSSYHMREISTPERAGQHSIIEKPKQLKSLFEYLEKEEDKWQQAYCLRLYFLMTAPMSQIMAARWDQLQVNTYSRRSDGAFLFDGLDWVYGKKWSSSEPIRTIGFELLVKSKRRIKEQFAKSQYWFPSPSKHHEDNHIKSVNILWEQCLRDLKLEYITPKNFRTEYHEKRYFQLDRAMGIEDTSLALDKEKMKKLSIGTQNSN